MPEVSKAQHRWAEGCLHNPRHMKGQCPGPQVAREFAQKRGTALDRLPERKRKARG